jgi:hypothetical protein
MNWESERAGRSLFLWTIPTSAWNSGKKHGKLGMACVAAAIRNRHLINTSPMRYRLRQRIWMRASSEYASQNTVILGCYLMLYSYR